MGAGTAQRMRSIRATAPNKTRVGLAPTSSLYSKQQYRVPNSPTGSHLQKPHSIKKKHEQVRHQQRRLERNYAAGATERPKKENNRTGFPA